MAIIHQCDNCGEQAKIPDHGGYGPTWCVLVRHDPEIRTSLLFCSEGCVADYYLAKRLVEGSV